MTTDEYQALPRISRSRTEAARRVEQARILLALGAKERVAEIAQRHQLDASLTSAALRQALEQRIVVPGLVHHPD